MDIRKEFPEQYIKPVVQILNGLSLSGKPEIVGSGADRKILYAADFDANDLSSWSPTTARRLRDKILHLDTMRNVRVGDIKAGVVPEWNILCDGHVTKGKVLGYNYEVAKEKVESLFQRGIILQDEHKEALELLKPHPTGLEFLVAQKALRFGVVRWCPKNIASGFVKLRDGTTLSFADAILQKTPPKVDLVVWIENRFVECEMLYFLKYKGEDIVENDQTCVERGIKESLLIFASEGNWMKVAKRMYSLARLQKATYVQERLRDHIFNSDLGRLYSVLNDATTLETLKEEGVNETEKARIMQETDGFRARLALITLPPLLKPKDPFAKDFIPSLCSILQPSVKSTLLHLNLLPLPAKWKI